MSGAKLGDVKLIREHIVPDFDEDLSVVATLQTDEGLWYTFGGSLAVVYVSKLEQKQAIKAAQKQECAEHSIYGHFKTITDLKMLAIDASVLTALNSKQSKQNAQQYHLLMSASEDFSVRIWLVNKAVKQDSDSPPGPRYLQLLQYLDVNQWNSEVLATDFDYVLSGGIPRRILSLDVNQNLRLWPLGQRREAHQHVLTVLSQIN